MMNRAAFSWRENYLSSNSDQYATLQNKVSQSRVTERKRERCCWGDREKREIYVVVVTEKEREICCWGDRERERERCCWGDRETERDMMLG